MLSAITTSCSRAHTDEVVRVAINASTSRPSKGGRILSLDTQASHGITNMLDLFGGVPLKNNLTFIICDWAQEERTCTQHGDTFFGAMLYSELVEVL